jgi:hypothetical protein
VSDEVVPEMDPDLEPVPGKVATLHPSPEKGMLWRGFLLQRSLGVIPERCRLCSLESSSSPTEDAGTPVISVDGSVVRGKQFSFPLVISAAAPTFFVPAIVSSGSKFDLCREAIQLYRISRRELEKRLSIACFVFFVDKGGDSRIEVRDVG